MDVIKKPQLALTFTIATFGLIGGALVALLEPATTVRLAAIPVLLFAIALAWAHRKKSNSVSEPLLRNIMTLTILVSVVWPRYIFFHPGGLPGFNPNTALTLFSCMALLGAYLWSPSLSTRISEVASANKKLFLFISCYIAWKLLCAFTSPYGAGSVLALFRELAFLDTYILIGLFASAMGMSESVIRTLRLCLILTLIIGAYEALKSANPLTAYAGSGIDGASTDAIRSITASKIRGGVYRLQSTFDHPIAFAQFLAATAPLALLQVQASQGWGKRAFWLIVSILAVAEVYLTGSRAGLLAVLASIAIFITTMWMRYVTKGGTARLKALLMLPVIAAAITAVALASVYVSSGTTRHEYTSTQARLQMLYNASDALVDSPITGFGFGTSGIKAGLVGETGGLTIDSLPITLALDHGYVGLLLFIAAVILPLAKYISSSVQTGNQNYHRSAATAASLLGILTVFSFLSITQNMSLLWLLAYSQLPLNRTET